jgi:hypothetical protein
MAWVVLALMVLENSSTPFLKTTRKADSYLGLDFVLANTRTVAGC